MFVQGTPLIVPTQPLWLGCLFLIGIFGFAAQVSPPDFYLPFAGVIQSHYFTVPVDIGTTTREDWERGNCCLLSGRLDSKGSYIPNSYLII
jgi:hypothetical protein